MDLSGKDLTDYLRQLLREKGIVLQTPQEIDVVRDIKETLCYVVSDFDSALQDAQESNANEKTYDLPDGRKIVLGSERFKCPEALFQPFTARHELDGIHKYCYDAVMRCDIEQRKDLFENVILSGGSTLFEGLAERMWQELHQLAPSKTKIKVYSPPERLFSIWFGASTLASLSTF